MHNQLIINMGCILATIATIITFVFDPYRLWANSSMQYSHIEMHGIL